MNNGITLGERLSQFLIYRNMNQKQLGDILGIAPITVSQYINNQRSPRAEYLAVIASMGCNLNWLLTGEGEMLYNPEVETPESREETKALIVKLIQEKL